MAPIPRVPPERLPPQVTAAVVRRVPQTWGRPGEAASPGGLQGRGCEAGELRREFGGGPAPLAARLLSWRRLRTGVSRVPSRFGPQSVPPSHAARASSSQQTEQGQTPWVGQDTAGPSQVPCTVLPARRRNPRRICHPGAKLSRPASRPPPSGRGGGAATASPPGNILRVPLAVSPPHPSFSPPLRGSSALPLAAVAVTRDRPGWGSGVRRSLEVAARLVLVCLLPWAPSSARLRLAQRRGTGGLPEGWPAGGVRRLCCVTSRPALPLPLRGGRCPTHLAGRLAVSSGWAGDAGGFVGRFAVCRLASGSLASVGRECFRAPRSSLKGGFLPWRAYMERKSPVKRRVVARNGGMLPRRLVPEPWVPRAACLGKLLVLPGLQRAAALTADTLGKQ